MKKLEDMQRIMKKYNCAPHQVMDYRTKEINEAGTDDLCPRCDGTGNELFSMYRECEACGGSGVKNPNYNYED